MKDNRKQIPYEVWKDMMEKRRDRQEELSVDITQCKKGTMTMDELKDTISVEYPDNPKDGFSPIDRLFLKEKMVLVKDNRKETPLDISSSKRIFGFKIPKEKISKLNGLDMEETWKKLDMNLMIMVSTRSPDVLEGSPLGSPRDMKTFDENISYLTSIPIKDITDYNSIWEITKTGWDTPKEIQDKDVYFYPYINIDGEWWRWDSIQVREWTGLLKWTDENYQKFYKSKEFLKMTKVKGESKNPIVKPPKIGRNELCHCGSGIKFKKCCLN